MKKFLKKIGLRKKKRLFKNAGIKNLKTLKKKYNSKKKLRAIGLNKDECKSILVALKSEKKKSFSTKLIPSEMVTYLAHPWDEYIKEKHPNVKLFWLIDTSEIIIRWLCALLLAEHRYANHNQLPTKIQQLFKDTISRPTLGIWLNILESLSHIPLKQSIFPEISSFYSNFLNVKGLFPNNGDEYQSLLKLRNRIAHGGGITKSQSKKFLKIYEPHLIQLLLKINNLMGTSKLYGSYANKIYLLKGLQPKEKKVKSTIIGPFIIYNKHQLSLWPLMDYDKIRKINSDGIIQETNTIVPQTYTRIDKYGIHFTPLGIDDSYSLSNKQLEFENFFSLNQKVNENKSKNFSHQYHYKDFLKEAQYLKEELIGRTNEIKKIKQWLKEVNPFDKSTTNCKLIYGGPGLGKSMLMAKIASDSSNNSIHHTFYYRFRSGDIRNSKHWFLKLLNDCLKDWLDKTSNKQYTHDKEILKEILQNINLIKKLPLIKKSIKNKNGLFYNHETRPTLRIFIDGLDEVLFYDSSILTIIKSLIKDGVILLLATRLEYSAKNLQNTSWIEPFIFRNDINGLPPMSTQEIRGMLFEGISKLEKKKLIKNDIENKTFSTINPIVDAITKKANGLPLYITLLLHDIEVGKYTITDIKKMPNGLKNYYIELVNRMGINDTDAYKVRIVTLLSLVSEPIDIESITLILEDIDDITDIKEALENTSFISNVLTSIGSLTKQTITLENTVGYTLYHQSFKDFILDANQNPSHQLYRTLKSTKKLLSLN